MPDPSQNIYESDRVVSEYLLFHYGSQEEILPYAHGPAGALNFAVRTVTELTGARSAGRTLDLGCAVGRSSFELSRFCDEVVGIDFSVAFIDAAERLRIGEMVSYRRLEEGSIATELRAGHPAGSHPERIRFEWGDAMNLREDLGSFDLVHAANLLCRLTHPQRLLRRLPTLVKSGGELILTTPCTWLEEFTPRENWPPGRTLDWLVKTLLPYFELELQRDLPFLIREHARKFQWSVALGTRWRRR